MSKVGQYAVISIDFNTWFNEEQPKVLTKNKKQKTKKKIIYPLFLDFASLTTDPFWIKKFNVWANGKLPKYFSIIDDTLIYKKGNDQHTLKLNNVDECISFFRNHGGLFSKKNEIEESSESTTIIDSYEPVEVLWGKSNKKTQELLVKEYVATLSKTMGLSSHEQSLLLQTVRLSITSKNFNKNNIELSNNKIVHIKGLMCDQESKVFRLDTSSRQIKKKSVVEEVDVEPDYPKDMVTNYKQKIDKYNKYFAKKVEKYKK